MASVCEGARATAGKARAGEPNGAPGWEYGSGQSTFEEHRSGAKADAGELDGEQVKRRVEILTPNVEEIPAPFVRVVDVHWRKNSGAPVRPVSLGAANSWRGEKNRRIGASI